MHGDIPFVYGPLRVLENGLISECYTDNSHDKIIEQYSSITKFFLMHPMGNINLNKTRLIRLIYVFKTQEPIYSLNMYASGKTASIKNTFCHFRVSRKSVLQIYDKKFLL